MVMRDQKAIVSFGFFFQLDCNFQMIVVGYVQSRKQRTGASFYIVFCEFASYLVYTQKISLDGFLFRRSRQVGQYIVALL